MKKILTVAVLSLTLISVPVFASSEITKSTSNIDISTITTLPDSIEDTEDFAEIESTEDIVGFEKTPADQTSANTATETDNEAPTESPAKDKNTATDVTITETPSSTEAVTATPSPTVEKDPWFQLTFKNILFQLITACVIFVIPGMIIYMRRKK